MRGRNVRVARSASTGSCDFTVKKRRGGFELVMECGGCGAEPGLENPRCFRNVLDVMQREGMPLAITMRSHIEKRYGAVASGTMGRIAGILNRVENLQRQLAQASARDGNCRQCAGPAAARLAALVHCLRSMDMAGALNSANALGRQEFGSGLASCDDCKGMTAVQVTDIDSSARDLEKAVLRNAFGIVEG